MGLVIIYIIYVREGKKYVYHKDKKKKMYGTCSHRIRHNSFTRIILLEFLHEQEWGNCNDTSILKLET